MKPSIRLVAALLALLGLLTFEVEGAWAAVCVADTDAAHHSTMVDGESAGCTDTRPDPSGERGSQAPACPISMGMTGPCTGLALLPVTAPDASTLASERSLPLPSPGDARELLLPLSFFRPPIA